MDINQTQRKDVESYYLSLEKIKKGGRNFLRRLADQKFFIVVPNSFGSLLAKCLNSSNLESKCLDKGDR